MPHAAWLGWSLGGQFALHAALDFPPEVRGLVMIAVLAALRDRRRLAARREAELFGDFGEALRPRLPRHAGRLPRAGSIRFQHAQDELRSLKAQAFERGEPAPHALQEGLLLLDGLDLRDELPKLRVPSLWLSGRRDRLVPAGAMPEAAAMTPGCTQRRHRPRRACAVPRRRR